MPVKAHRKSSKQTKQDETRTIQDTVVKITETVEDEERLLYKKLGEKYAGEATGERVPGKTVRGIKTSWTFNDMVARYPIVTFISDDTMPLTWNGVKVQLRSGWEHHLPEPFYALYKSHKAALREKQNIPGVIIDLGAGSLPPDL